MKGQSTNEHRQSLPSNFFDRDALEVARSLIGVTLLVDGIGGMIVETEAYDETDPASHCFEKWRSAINDSMYLSGGHAYVCPGRHFYHLNFVCRESGFGSAVLIRAIEPDSRSIGTMKERRDHFFARPPSRYDYLCNRPGPLCEALAIGAKHDGSSLFCSPFELFDRTTIPPITETPRIGITKAREKHWRFVQEATRSNVMA